MGLERFVIVVSAFVKYFEDVVYSLAEGFETAIK